MRAVSPIQPTLAPKPSSSSSTTSSSAPRQNEQWAVVDSDEAHWNSGRNGTANLGHRNRPKEGYFPVAPNDTLQDLRTADGAA